MLVTPQSQRRNQRIALTAAIMAAVIIGVFAYFRPVVGFLLVLCPVIYWWIRRQTIRRDKVLAQPFPKAWERVLISQVEFFAALDETRRERFRSMVKVFLDETPITGVRTEVDDQTRVLVAASAIIPVFGFDDWEYSRLGEVLIYLGRFDSEYQTDGSADRNTLGMIGVSHLSGVMILSKPDLIAGFSIDSDKRNVGIHEFAHLVDQADGAVDGLPAGIPADVVNPWISWVGQELESESAGGHHIDDYAYTNRAEYLAVLTEYFFESPELLKQKNPAMYAMLKKMYRQDTVGLLSSVKPRRNRRIGRNSPCPCGSGKKYKRCCR
ncbi:zinc-dependent peptidase [Planctomycetes bacterium K23_9]|uniref:zinc-dependent peptidase n=1 Tax=Stieleria marina TaxID=1930275 RepID=UPI00119EE480